MSGKEKDKDLLKIILQPTEAPAAKADYQIIRIDPKISAFQKPKAPPVYATHCLVDLGKWRRKAKRWLEKQAEWPDCEPERAQILRNFSELLMSMTTQALPEVVVMAWNEDGPIQTNSAVVDGIIFLNHKLSADWAPGKESNEALRTLINAIESLTQPLMETGSLLS